MKRGIVKGKISINELTECFKHLEEYCGDHGDVVQFHPQTRKYKVLPVALEFEEDNEVFGNPFLKFKKYETCYGRLVWRLETEIDIVSEY